MFKCVWISIGVVGVVAGSVLGDGVLCATEPYLGHVDFVSVGLENDEARDIKVVDGIAYVAADESGLQIIDVSDPSNMVVLGRIALGGEAQNLVYHEAFFPAKVVYVATGSDGVAVVDVVDPSNPVEIARIVIPEARDVAMNLQQPSVPVLAVASGAEGIRTYDVSFSIAPALKAVLPTSGSCVAVEVQTIAGVSFLYAADGDVDVFAMSLWNGSSLGAVNTPGDARDLAYSGDVVFVADGFHGVEVVDFSAGRANGVIEDNIPLNFSTRKVTVDGDRLYAAENTDDVFVIGIADPTSPNVDAIISTMGNGSCVGADGTDVLIGTQNNGMISVDANDLSAFQTSAELGSFGWGDGNISNPHRTAVAGGTAYVPRSTLEIFDVSSDVPSLVSSFDTGDTVVAVDVAGTVAYAVDGAGLKLINISNPALPILLGQVSTPGSANHVLVDSGIAYVADLAGGMHAVDVSNPASPTIIGNYMAGSDVLKVLFVGDSVFGRVAHVLTEDSIDVVSLLDESMPGPLGPGVVIANSELYAAVSDGDYVYQLSASLVDGKYTLSSIDVTNPLFPSVVSQSNAVGYLQDVVQSVLPEMELADGMLSFTDFESGLVMFDVSDPTDIRFAGVFNEWGGSAMAWTTVGDRGYLRLGGEFRVYDMSVCLSSCPADLNGDGALDFFDVAEFLEAYGAQDPAADFTGDGAFDFFDVAEFLEAYAAGCL